MIPLLSAGLMVRAARTLPAGRRDRVALVCRPRGVVHVAVAPLTPSGRWLIAGGRTVCNTHTRRLAVVPRCHELPDIAGRRVCVRCLTALASRTAVPGLAGRPMTRAQEVEVFELVTPVQLSAIAATCATVDETHQVGRLASVLYGPATVKAKARRTPAEQQVVDLNDTIHAARRRLTTAAMTDDERDAGARGRQVEAAESARLQTSLRRGYARDRAIDRSLAGKYLLPHERQLLNSA